MHKYQNSTMYPHLISLYEAPKQREKRGRLCGFGVLSKILHHRAVCLLKRDDSIKGMYKSMT